MGMTKPPGASWGIRIGGGVDRGKVLVLEKIIFNSIAYEMGLKNRDYIVDINGTKVFEMNHDDCKDLIRKAGDNMKIKQKKQVRNQETNHTGFKLWSKAKEPEIKLV